MTKVAVPTYVYLLQHCRLNDGGVDWKLIGYFSAREKAVDVAQQLKSKEGFREPFGSFKITELKIGVNYWPLGFYTRDHPLAP